jgi:hypothetical protein
MKSRELIKQHDQIKLLIEQTKLSTDSNLELQGHWGRYICILVAGFLENAIGEVYVKFITDSSSPQVAQYTITTLKKVQNPKASKFIETASKFKKEWGEQLEAFLENDGRKDAIDSIMRTRHQIAHGKDTRIGVVQVKNHFEKSIEVIEFIESQCDTNINPVNLSK